MQSNSRSSVVFSYSLQSADCWSLHLSRFTALLQCLHLNRLQKSGFSFAYFEACESSWRVLNNVTITGRFVVPLCFPGITWVVALWFSYCLFNISTLMLKRCWKLFLFHWFLMLLIHFWEKIYPNVCNITHKWLPFKRSWFQTSRNHNHCFPQL